MDSTFVQFIVLFVFIFAITSLLMYLRNRRNKP